MQFKCSLFFFFYRFVFYPEIMSCVSCYFRYLKSRVCAFQYLYICMRVRKREREYSSLISVESLTPKRKIYIYQINSTVIIH